MAGRVVEHMAVLVWMFVAMFVSVPVLMLVPVLRLGLVGITQMHIEFHPFDLAAFGPMGVKMVVVQRELPQLPLDLVEVHAQVNHRAQEHVPADAAENIQVKSVQAFSCVQVF
jgi:hypothetical protein